MYPLVEAVYEKWLDTPNGEKAHAALHTTYGERRRIHGDSISLGDNHTAKQLEVAVCVGTSCYIKGSYDLLQNLGQRLREAKLNDRVDLKATFCFENCGGGINVKVGDTLYSGMSPAKTESLFAKIVEELEK